MSESTTCDPGFVRVRVRRDVYDWLADAARRHLFPSSAEVSRMAWRKWRRLEESTGLEVEPLGPCGRKDPKLRVPESWVEYIKTIWDGPVSTYLTGIMHWYLTNHDKGDVHPALLPDRAFGEEEPYRLAEVEIE